MKLSSGRSPSRGPKFGEKKTLTRSEGGSGPRDHRDKTGSARATFACAARATVACAARATVACSARSVFAAAALAACSSFSSSARAALLAVSVCAAWYAARAASIVGCH